MGQVADLLQGEPQVSAAGIRPEGPATTRVPLRAVAGLFAFLGITGFGGPAAHIAMMEDHVVRRRAWMPREAFLELLGMANLLPGPSSTELAMFIGHRVAGWRGLIVAGLGFILPAAVIVGVLARLYVAFGTLGAVDTVFAALTPVVLAVMVHALWTLGHTALKTRWLAGGALVAIALSAAHMPTLALLGIGALWGGLPVALKDDGRGTGPAPPVPALWPVGLSWLAPLGGAAASLAAPASLGMLAFVFLRVGTLVFGSGYVLLAFLRDDLVTRLHWITERQLLDAIAVGQVTPGPVFTTATFVGFLSAGPAGAIVATIAIFTPAFVFVAVGTPLLRQWRASPVASAALEGVAVASLGMLAVVIAQFAESSLRAWWHLALFVVALVLMLRWRIHSAWLLLGGAALGTALGLAR